MAWERKGRVLQAEDAYNTKGAPQDPDFQGKVMACREKYQLPPTKQDRVMEKNAKLLAE